MIFNSNTSSVTHDSLFSEQAPLALIAMCLFLLIGSIGFLVVIYFTSPNEILSVRGLSPIALALMSAAALYFIIRNRTKSATFLLLCGTWFYIAWISAFEGGLRAPGFVVFPALILMVAWRIGVTQSIAMSVLTVFLCLLFYFFSHNNLLPTQLPDQPLETLLFTHILVFIFVALHAKLMIRSYRSKIEEVAKLTAVLSAERDQLEDIVDARTSDLISAKQAADSANSAKSIFLGKISHELRTPLHQISGLASIILREPLSAKQALRFQTLESSLDHMVSLVDSLIELTRLESGVACLEIEPLRISDIISQVSNDIRVKAESKGLRIIIESADWPGTLFGDKNRIYNALLQYAYNAVRFTATGQITFRSKLDPHEMGSVILRCEVEDTGPGVPEYAGNRIFESFEQYDNSLTRSHGGLGIGLSLTKKIAHLMGGDAGHECLPTGGSIFWFSACLNTSPNTPITNVI